MIMEAIRTLNFAYRVTWSHYRPRNSESTRKLPFALRNQQRMPNKEKQYFYGLSRNFEAAKIIFIILLPVCFDSLSGA